MTLRRNDVSRPNIALLDSASTHIILTDPRFFEFPKRQTSWQYCKITTMAASRNLKFREGRTNVIQPGGHTLICAGAMFAPEAPRSLINYKDLRANDIHISTVMDRGEEALELRRGQSLLATAVAGNEGLYRLVIQIISPISPKDVDEVCMADWPAGPELINRNLAQNVSKDTTAKPDLWHRRLGHPSETVFRRMLPLVVGHNLNALDAHKTTECTTCIQGKFSKKPSKWQLPTELPSPLYRIHGNVCGPINPPSGLFRYFFVIADASCTHFEVALLPTRNMVFPRLLGILIRYRNHFPDFPIKYMRMDNAQEFRSHTFEDCCVATGITLTYLVPYEHSQNGLAEAFIKKIQLVTRPLLLHANLPSTMWGHAVMHATTLLKLRPTLLNTQSPLELQSGRTPNISFLRVFGCQVWVPVPEPKRMTIGAHREEGIYVEFDSPSIIRYLVPATRILLKARFQNCRFIENIFPKVQIPDSNQPLDFTAPETLTMNPDFPTGLVDTEVNKIVHLKSLAEQIPDGFASGPRIIRNPIPGTGNHLLQKKPAKAKPAAPKPPKKQAKPKVLYTFGTLESDPTSLGEAEARPDWPKWEAAIEAEYASLKKHQVFRSVVTDLDKTPIGHKMVFTRKLDANGNVLRYKGRFVA